MKGQGCMVAGEVEDKWVVGTMVAINGAAIQTKTSLCNNNINKWKWWAWVKWWAEAVEYSSIGVEEVEAFSNNRCEQQIINDPLREMYHTRPADVSEFFEKAN